MLLHHTLVNQEEGKPTMESGKSGTIHATEFGCQGPLKFYEHCSSCPQSSDDCADLGLGMEILRGKKKLIYNENDHSENTVHAGEFKCLTPLYYFEHSRNNCAHKGRCREEGLLIALLTGKKILDYARKSAVELPRPMRRRKAAAQKIAAQQ